VAPEEISCGAICAYLINFVRSDVFAALVVALVSSWGAVMISERWARRRERDADDRRRRETHKSRLMDHVAELVKWYQVNVRILRQEPTNRDSSELNLAHASYLANVKMLSIEPALKGDADALKEIGRKMSYFGSRT